MTIGLAWIGKRPDGREHLYLASDSRVTGGQRLDACPKILTLPRSDCAVCFAGHTAWTFPLMLHLAYAIAAHEPARDRSLDIARVKAHLLRLFSDLVLRIKELPEPFAANDAQFIFAGYSWLKKDFRIWTIQYLEKEKKFSAWESLNFIPSIRKAAFIGDMAKDMRALLAQKLGRRDDFVYLEPLKYMSEFLQSATNRGSVGGPPQIVRITQHMTTRPLCVRWNGEDTLFGRPLFEYENIDYWTVDPINGRFFRPRKFGFRARDEATASEREIDDREPD